MYAHLLTRQAEYTCLVAEHSLLLCALYRESQLLPPKSQQCQEAVKGMPYIHVSHQLYNGPYTSDNYSNY